jgi:hypothetical protein
VTYVRRLLLSRHVRTSHTSRRVRTSCMHMRLVAKSPCKRLANGWPDSIIDRSDRTRTYMHVYGLTLLNVDTASFPFHGALVTGWLAMLLPCSLYFSSQRGVRAHAHGKLRELGGTVVLCSTVYVEDLTSRTSAVVVAYVAPFWYRSARMHGYDLAGIRSIHACI